jgi:hypothetical protein
MLVACCLELEALSGRAELGERWVSQLREQTRRYPAFQEALRDALRRVSASPRQP